MDMQKITDSLYHWILSTSHIYTGDHNENNEKTDTTNIAYILSADG